MAVCTTSKEETSERVGYGQDWAREVKRQDCAPPGRSNESTSTDRQSAGDLHRWRKSPTVHRREGDTHVRSTVEWHCSRDGKKGWGCGGAHLDHHREATADHAIAVTPASHTYGTRLSMQRKPMATGENPPMELRGSAYRRSEVCIRETPSYCHIQKQTVSEMRVHESRKKRAKAVKVGRTGTRCMRRTSNRTLLEDAHNRMSEPCQLIEGERNSWRSVLVPLHDRALDLEEGEADGRLPRLGRLRTQGAKECEFGTSLAKGGTRSCLGNVTLRIRLLRVSRIFVF